MDKLSMRSLSTSQGCAQLLLWLAISCSIFGPLSFAEETRKPKRIAILELADRTRGQVSREEIHYLTNEMRRIAGLLPRDLFLVMTKENIEVLIDPGQSLEECVGSCEVETGRLLGADWILTGEVIRFGKSLRVSVKLHDTRSGQYLAGESLKGKEVEDLELPIQRSTLKLVYLISPALERRAQAQAGPELTQQLECLKQRSACHVNRASETRIAEYRPKPSPKPRPVQTSSAPSTSPSGHEVTSGYQSQSNMGVTVDGFGLLLFGPTVALEFGQQASLRLTARLMTLGALSSVALAPEEGDSLESGASVGVGYRKFNDRVHARRGLYWGIDLEYMVIETSYTELDSSFSTTSDVLTGVFHFGYRWVSEEMLIGDLFSVGLWLALAQPLESEQSFSDDYDWPESYTAIDHDIQVYGGVSVELGWMF